MADKRISQLTDRGTVANSDVVPIVVSGAVTTNKATISSIQTYMQGNLDLGVTSVGITLGSAGTDVSVSGSPVTSSGNITINLPTASATNRGLLSAADWITFNSKQPAGNYVTLDTVQTITAQKTFTGSGSSDTMIISHGSGSGFGLDVIKAGNGETLRVTKTSGSGNAMTVIGGNFEAPTIVKTGGTSSQFLKADGSIDSTAYTTNTGTVTSVGLSSATSGVTIGSTPITTSGTITLAIATASGSQNGLLSSTDWTTFNGKQNALTNPVTGTGATGQVAYWTSTNSQTGSNNLFWDNANVKLGIGTNTPEGTGLTVAGGGVLISLDSGAARKVLELYATSTGAKVSSSYVGASSYGNLELLTSGLARLTIADTGASTFSGALNGTSAAFSGNLGAGVSSFSAWSGGTENVLQVKSASIYEYGGYETGLSVNAYYNSGWKYIGTNVASQIVVSSGAFTFNRSVSGTAGNAISWIPSLTIADTGAATFSSSVTAKSLKIENTGVAGFIYFNNTSAPASNYIALGSGANELYFHVNGSDRMVITDNGRVGIGTATPGFRLDVSANAAEVMRLRGGAGGGSNNNTQLRFYGAHAATDLWAIGTEVSTGGTDRNFDFYDLVAGANRMRITSGGSVLVNRQTLTSAGINVVGSLQVNNEVMSTGTNGGLFWENRSGGVTSNSNWYGWYTTGGTIFLFNGAANVASINPATGVYTPLSDENKKKDFEDSKIGLNEILNLKPTLYRMESDESEGEKELGFIAQEVKEFIPQAYVEGGEEDAKFIGLNYNAIVAALVKSVQELKTEIDSLKNQIK